MTPDEFMRTSALVLIPARRKGPVDDGWQNAVVSMDEARCHLGAGGNVGVINGARSGGLADADLDCREALDLAPIYLQPTGARSGRPTKPLSHWWYYAPGAVYTSFADPLDSTMLVELRADGATGGRHQTLIPPSVADGERREWESDEIAPAAVNPRILQRRVTYLAVAALVRRYISPYASERPAPDLVDLLWEFDRDLARPAYRWLGRKAPDEPRQYPKRRGDMTATERDLAEIMNVIPNEYDWNGWVSMGLAIHAVDSSEHGLIVFDDFSAKSLKYDRRETEARWRHFDRSPGTRTGLGKLAAMARRYGWQPSERGAANG